LQGTLIGKNARKDIMVIKPLAKRFRSYNVFYLQLERRHDIALYELRYNQSAFPIGYDVVGVRRKDVDGQEIEVYPPSSKWGTDAWSFSTLLLARNKFEALVKKAGTIGDVWIDLKEAFDEHCSPDDAMIGGI
jgi:hypothetical protein